MHSLIELLLVYTARRAREKESEREREKKELETFKTASPLLTIYADDTLQL